MNGPDHYRQAERLLAAGHGRDDEGQARVVPSLIAAAQVHATLALAAATADSYLWQSPNSTDWQEAIR